MFVCVLAGSGGMRWQGGDKMCGCSFEALLLEGKAFQTSFLSRLSCVEVWFS